MFATVWCRAFSCHLLPKILNVSCKNYNFLVVLYGCETCIFSTEERTQTEMCWRTRVLRKVFGSEKERVTGRYRILHNEEHQYLFSLPHTRETNQGWDGWEKEHADKKLIKVKKCKFVPVQTMKPYTIFIHLVVCLMTGP